VVAKAVERAENPLPLDHFPQRSHHRHSRFFLHRLRIINLAGGVVQNDRQVLPAVVLKPLLPAAIDVQQHSRQRSPLPPPPIHPALAFPTHRPCSLQCLLRHRWQNHFMDIHHPLHGGPRIVVRSRLPARIFFPSRVCKADISCATDTARFSPPLLPGALKKANLSSNAARTS